MGQTQRADHLICILAVLAEMLRRIQASISMVLQKAQEVVALDEIQLAWLQRFCGQFVRLARYSCMQAQHFTRLRNPQNERFSIPRGRGKLHAPRANNVSSAGGLSFQKQNRTLRISAGILDFFQIIEGAFWKFAEE